MEDEILKQIADYFNWTNAVFILIGFVGMYAHACKKYLTNTLSGTVTEYLFKYNKKRSILAFLTTLGTLAGCILGEQVPTQAGAFILLAFTTGYTADSTVNKDGIGEDNA